MTKEIYIKIKDKITIPISELIFQFSTSSGPGGQHANRSATRVTLCFDVAHSPSLDDNIRLHLLEELAHRLDKEGILHIHVQDTRSQKRNREIAISRLMSLLSDAVEEPAQRVKTSPSPTKLKKRKSEKKKLSQRKEERRRDWSNET